MKRFILISTLATLACLFVAGQALSAGHQNTGMGTSGSNQAAGMMGENLTPDQIREAQSLLNDRGFKAGAVDGICDQQTRAAIREFQKSEKLTITGTLDNPTLRVLAPTTEKQEFFGLSPAFGEQGSKTMEKQPEPVKVEPVKE